MRGRGLLAAGSPPAVLAGLAVLAALAAPAFPASAAAPDSSYAAAPDSSYAPDTTAVPSRNYRQALGVSVGLPQLIALTWEIEPLSPFRLQANLGSILLIWSGSVRVLLTESRWTVQPYLFGGGGTLFGVHLEDFDGFDPYLWVGYGVRVRLKRILVFAEMGFFESVDDEISGPGPAAEVLFRY